VRELSTPPERPTAIAFSPGKLRKRSSAASTAGDGAAKGATKVLGDEAVMQLKSPFVLIFPCKSKRLLKTHH
jgi:hypothetical protein